MGGGGGGIENLGKLENIRFGVTKKLKCEVNNYKYIYQTNNTSQIVHHFNKVSLIPVADLVVYLYIFCTLLYFLSKLTSSQHHFPPKHPDLPLKSVETFDLEHVAKKGLLFSR